MSLRAFHVIFIVATIVLSLFVALWGIREYAQQRSAGALGLGIIFLLTAVALTIYGKKAFAKYRELP